MSRLALASNLIALFAPLLCGAESRWIRGTAGSLEVVSDAGNKQALEILGAFEEFRYALGESVGIPDLGARPAIRLLVLKSAALPGPAAPGRDRYVIPLSADRGIPPEVTRESTRVLLGENVARMPEGITNGLTIFLSTIEVRGAHVIWGAPPPPSERTLDWARIHLLATKPEYYGKLKILLFNLRNGIDEEPAFRNAIGKSAREFSEEAEQYWKRGLFTSADGPSRPLNPLRDFKVQQLTAGDVRLAMADLLNAKSEAAYLALVKENIHVTEAYEGLALLALRAHDAEAAKDYLAKATDAGSDNAAIWVEWAKLGTNRGESVTRALELDPNNAEAHYLAGLQKDEPEQLKKAAELSPQNVEYWDALAQSYVGKGKYPEAGKAWRSAEMAAVTGEQREQMRQRWLGIENRKLDSRENDRRRDADEKQQEITRLKKDALAQLHAAEAKFNGKNTADPNVPVVAWDDVQPVHLEGTLKQVDCLGKQTRVVLETADHQTTKLLVRNRAGLACGPQNSRRVAVDYDRKADGKLGTAGELESLPR